MTNFTDDVLTVLCDCGQEIRLYTSKGAAEYLDLALTTVKYHTYEENLFPYRIPGDIMLFDERELDRFQANKRGPGRRPDSEK